MNLKTTLWMVALSVATLAGMVECKAENIAASAGTRNIALASAGAVAVADSVYGGDVPGCAIDGKMVGPADKPGANRWHAALERPHPHWIWIRFRQASAVSEVVLHRSDLVGYPVDFVGEFSRDGGLTFQTLFSVTNCHEFDRSFSVRRTFAPVIADNFRLRILRSSNTNNPDYAQISEVEVLGNFVAARASAPQTRIVNGLKHSLLRPSPLEQIAKSETTNEIEFRSPWLRVAFSKNAPQITALSWDSLGEGKLSENLLKTGPGGGARLRPNSLFEETTAPALEVSRQGPTVQVDGNVVRYLQGLPGGGLARWEIRVEPKTMKIALASITGRPVARAPLQVQFAFDVSKTSVAPLANPKPGVSASLPCLLHAADYGTLALSPASSPALCLTGQPLRRLAQWNAFVGPIGTTRASDGLMSLPSGSTEWAIECTVTPQTVPLPDLVEREASLKSLPRSWLNTFQYRPDIGILANNIVSDNAVFCMFTFTDPAVFTPPLPGGVEAIQLARESLDRYFNGATGYGIGWEDIETDTYPSLLISAWDVVRVTGDLKLLRHWLPALENLAAKAIAQDHNGNGLPESSRTGLRGTTKCPTGNWWDQINFGHEDAYVCALSYRAFQGLADLERLAHKPEQAARYDERARKIAAVYVPNFLNPETGILAGWKDTEGHLHDYWFVFINGMAITYGLVPEELGQKIVDRIEAKMLAVGYTRFDLGLPGNLIPVAQNDYGPGAPGSSQREDGSDGFGVFENGGASACYAYFYIQALYQLGRRAEAERILWPMMQSYAEGKFQNGVGHRGEWRRWDGSPSGYEGFLADAYYSQLALFTGHYGIGFGPDGFHLEKWSPLRGRRVPLRLKYMGRIIKSIDQQ